MDYYKTYRNPHVRPGAYTFSALFWSRLVHGSMAISLIFLSPYAICLVPLLVMMTAGERNRLVEEEALDAVNYAITAGFVLIALNGIIELLPKASLAQNVALGIRAIYMAVGAILAWQAQKKVGDRKPYHLSIQFVKPVWFNPHTDASVQPR